MSVRILFFAKACPAMKLHRVGIVAILLVFFAGTAWGNTQDQELAEKFSPILIFVEEPKNLDWKVIFPEPVEPVGATWQLGKFTPLTSGIIKGQAHA